MKNGLNVAGISVVESISISSVCTDVILDCVVFVNDFCSSVVSVVRSVVEAAPTRLASISVLVRSGET